MKNKKTVIIILAFLGIIGIAAATMFLIIRKNPALQLKLKRGWSAETLDMIKSAEEDEFPEEFWLSSKNGILYTDVYFAKEHEWYLCVTSTEYGEWAYLPVGNMHIDNGDMENVSYVSVARFADEKAFSGKIEEKGLDITVRLVPCRNGVVQFAVARAVPEKGEDFRYTDLIEMIYKHTAVSFDDLYAGGKPLDAETLQAVGSFLENGHEPLPWSFLGQKYRDVSEIDVVDLFYNWTEKISGEAEQEAAWKAGNMTQMRLETQKRTAKGMNELFLKYTGKELTKAQTDAFSAWIYLPEYDAYYSFLTDSNRPKVTLGRACYAGEKDAEELGLKDSPEQLIALEWTADANASSPAASSGMLLLAPSEGGWQIVANVFE